ncbi:MAG: ABC transporter permease [Bdellovibrionaceae bacterium]|nr:ABC transporter permease [Pseudobdellovibrionaceae bacterium]
MIWRDGFFRVWQRNFFYFRKTWSVSLFWIVLEPLMYLGAIGYGLGSFVNNMEGQSFVDFYFPGLLCSTAMMVSFFEGTYSNYTKLTYQKLYSIIMIAPLNPDEIVYGELLWSTTKGLLGVIGVALVSFFFGLVDSWRILPALLVLLLTSWLFSCAAMVMISYAKNYDSFIYATSGLIVPMSLISGTYFPIETLPTAMKIAAYALPLSHSIHSVRMILSDSVNWTLGLHLGYLIIVSLVLMKWSVRRITARLYS